MEQIDVKLKALNARTAFQLGIMSIEQARLLGAII